MRALILVIHLVIALVLIALILLQRSEGGALGIGGGGAGAMFSGRGAANVLTRATAILAAVFFITSLGLTMFARHAPESSSVFDQVQPSQSGAPSSGSTDQKSVLPQLPSTNQPQVPVGQ